MKIKMKCWHITYAFKGTGNCRPCSVLGAHLESWEHPPAFVRADEQVLSAEQCENKIEMQTCLSVSLGHAMRSELVALFPI